MDNRDHGNQTGRASFAQLILKNVMSPLFAPRTLRTLLAKEFDDGLHPRDGAGKFTESNRPQAVALRIDGKVYAGHGTERHGELYLRLLDEGKITSKDTMVHGDEGDRKSTRLNSSHSSVSRMPSSA